MPWYFVASSGPGSGSAFQLVGPSITIGRAAESDIAIDDNAVSRHHARLDKQGDTYLLTDLGSANGTWVNGRRVSTPVLLKAGDSIRFGERSVFGFSTQPSLGGVMAQDEGQVCPTCGGRSRPGVRFCGHCGQPLGVPSVHGAPAPSGAAGLPGWALVVGGVLIVLIVVLVVALIVLLVLPSRAEPTPLVVAQPTIPPITAIPLVPSPTPMQPETPIPIPPETPTLTPVPPTPTPAAGAQVIAAAEASAPTSTPTTLPPPPTHKPVSIGQIAFVSNRDGNDEIYVMNPDGSNQRRLTNTSGEEWHPAWSPDGTRIVFQCMSGGIFNVCVVNADGSGYTQITQWTQSDGAAQRAVWSPDGGKIAVTREVGGGQKLVVMDADGSNQREIVNLGRDPSWSPDGSRIAFVRLEGGGMQIWTVSPDGSNEKMLTQGDHDHMYPTWSPGGRQIAFEYDRTQVAVMDAGGGPPRVIANKGSHNLSWSPDGKKLVIAPSGEGIWVVNADGSGLTQIAQEGKQPSWQAVP